MNKYLVYGKASLAMLFWALTFVWIKIALADGYRPYEIVFLRLLLATLLLFGVILVSRKIERLEKRDLWQLILVSFCEPFAYFVGEANGMQYVSPTLGSLIISLIPIFSALGAWLILKERVSALLFLGLIVSTGGVVMMSFGEGNLSATVKGVLYLMLAVFAGMFYAITVRSLTHKYNTLTIVALQSLFGMLFFLPLFLYYDWTHFIYMSHSFRGLSTISAMSIFASVGAFMLYTGVIRELGVVKSNVFTNLIPVFTAMLAFFVMGTRFTGLALGGLILTVSGLLLSQYQDLRNLKRKLVDKEPMPPIVNP